MFQDQPAVLKIYNKVEFESGGIIKNANESAIKSKALADSSAAIEISTRWESVHKIGPGFQNMGNTCFFNSVLQCITYTPPLANYLLKGEHKKTCPRTNAFCAICLIETHVQQCFSQNRPPVIQPRQLLANMRHINKRFKLGRQDDSHELLRLLLESMQRSALDFRTKTDQKQEEATSIYKIFGGKLKSQVECSLCKYRSENQETFYDVSLECKETVEKSLEVFFKKEHLKGSNKYRCSKCKKLVDATKGYVIQQLPNVLTLQVKRFNNMMMKINQHTVFPAELNMSRFVQDSARSANEMYDLFGVLVHIGGGLHFGHYYCYVKNSNNMWYCMNDSSVSQRSFAEVQKDRAYLLFYVKRESVARPRRKSSADLSSIAAVTETVKNASATTPSASITTSAAAPVTVGAPATENGQSQDKKSLKAEYAEAMKSTAYDDHMKKLDSIFGIKSALKKDDATKPAVVSVTAPVVANKPEEKQAAKSAVAAPATAAPAPITKTQQIEEEKPQTTAEVEEPQAVEQERPFKAPFYLPFYPVVGMKRISKLRYMNDKYMRKQLKLDYIQSLPAFDQQSSLDNTIVKEVEQPKKNIPVQQEQGKEQKPAVGTKENPKRIEVVRVNQKQQQPEQNATPATKPSVAPVIAKDEKQAVTVPTAATTTVQKTVVDKLIAGDKPSAPVATQGLLLKALQNKVEATTTAQPMLLSLLGKKAEAASATTATATPSGPSPLKLNALDLVANSSTLSEWNMASSAQIKAARTAVVENNKQAFEFQKREKDEYDVKYDEGKLKKIKKKKEKQRINFDKLYSQKLKQQNKKQNK